MIHASRFNLFEVNALDPLIQAGDIILVKGSQAMRMEKVVEEIMATPRQVTQLLVRQEETGP